MYRKLQHNLDIIQYLVRDASSEQLMWSRDETSQSLGNIILDLFKKEMEYIRFQLPGLTNSLDCTPLSPAIFYKSGAAAAYRQAFEKFIYYRRSINSLLQKFSSQGQLTVNHQLLGRITLTELVARMDESDQYYIGQIEELVHNMPLNPLRSRALREIETYYQYYQIHLAQVSSVLDIGVGSGLPLQYVMQHNSYLTFAGVDVRDLRLPHVTVPLQIYDGHTLPFAANEFDISLLFYVFHHCLDPGRLLDEAVRVTRQKLIIIEEFKQPEADIISLELTERQSHRALGIPPDLPYYPFEQEEFESMLEERSLVQLERRQLPSKTSRPVQKYLYTVG